MKLLTEAILKVMDEVKGIDKNLEVGAGKGSYKGVADKDVKHIIGESMQKNGLVILPIGIEPKVKVSEWDQEETWNGQKSMKHKTQVFTEVSTKYLLMHVSGESMELQGYGHGVDSQDKSAGKATTYALKNTLLYTFLVPTGAIDDTDNTHSDNLPNRPAQPQRPPTPPQPAVDMDDVYDRGMVGQNCKKCQGKMVKNPKTGSWFCENKCWLKQ
jgi:hypothetical protein